MLRAAVMIVALAATSWAAPASGAETEWVEIAPGARLRLIADNVRQPDDSTRLALELEMRPDLKTYWRVPGEAGLPLSIELAPDQGIGEVEVHWPYPLREEKDGFLDHVFYGNLTLPITARLEGDGPARFTADLVLGVCSEVCVPAMASLDLELDFERPARAAALRIDLSERETILPARESLRPFGSVTVEGDALRVALAEDVPAALAASLIITAEGPDCLFDLPQIGPDQRSLLVPVRAGVPPAELVGTPVTLTFMTPEGPYAYALEVNGD